MKLSLAILAAAAAPAVVSGKRAVKAADVKKAGLAGTDLSNVDVKANSKTGLRLLSKARRLDGGDGDSTWIAGYSLKFHSCQASQEYYGGYFANQNGNNAENYEYNGEEGQQQGENGEYNANYQYDGENGANAYGENQYANGNGYYNNEEREDYEGMYNQNLVHFQLCPSNSCWRCKNGADYVVELGDFVDAMLEAKMQAHEYNCEKVRENCSCQNAYSENECLSGCYKNAGFDYCMEEEQQNENGFDIQEALECSKLEVDEEAVKEYYYSKMMGQNKNNYGQNNNGQYYGQQGQEQQGQDFEVGDVYVGPYCAKNGKSILLGTFMEETCSYPAPKGMYEAVNYGTSLPYSKQSIVAKNECISCMEPKEVDYQNYWDQQDEDEVTDVCSNLYEIAGKCEEGLDGYYPNRDITGCGFISSMKASGLDIQSATHIPAKVLATVFAVTTGVLALISMALYKRTQRQNVSLAGESNIIS